MKKRVLKIVKIVWFSLASIFVVWNWTTFQSRNLPHNTFNNDANVEVTETGDQIIFGAKHSAKTFEVIFFQGGLADPKAYAPLCRMLAKNGYTCHLIKMSFRLPQYDYQKISTMFNLQSKDYVIAGHSQGGKMAAQFVYEHPETMKGLILMGTSHPRDVNISGQKIPVIKFYSSNDGLASATEVLDNRDKLPDNAKMIFIDGGNHSQFGYLGNLFLDDKADITLEEQQSIVLRNTVQFLDELQKTDSAGFLVNRTSDESHLKQ